MTHLTGFLLFALALVDSIVVISHMRRTKLTRETPLEGDVETFIASIRTNILAIFPDYEDTQEIISFIRMAVTFGFPVALDVALRDKNYSTTSKEHAQDTAIALPPRAPELYKNRPMGRKENIIAFLRRVWKPWMDARLLTRKKLKEYDKDAYAAVDNWIRHNRLPRDIYLPTQCEINNALLRQHKNQSRVQLKRLAALLEARARRAH